MSNRDIVTLALTTWAFAIVPASMLRFLTPDPLQVLFIALVALLVAGAIGPLPWIVSRLPLRVHEPKRNEVRRLNAMWPLAFVGASSGIIAVLITSGGFVTGNWMQDVANVLAFVLTTGILIICPILLGEVIYVAGWLEADEDRFLKTLSWTWGRIEIAQVQESPAPEIGSEWIEASVPGLGSQPEESSMDGSSAGPSSPEGTPLKVDHGAGEAPSGGDGLKARPADAIGDEGMLQTDS